MTSQSVIPPGGGGRPWLYRQKVADGDTTTSMDPCVVGVRLGSCREKRLTGFGGLSGFRL